MSLPRIPQRLAAGFFVVAGIAFSPFALAQSTATEPGSTPASTSSDYTLTANLSLASEYRYRGLMQTNSHPALQGGFDLNHASGFYIGNWNSNVSWLDDSSPAVSAPLEMDFYAGFKTKLANDVMLDAGVLRYYYPGDYPTGYTSPNTTEVYASVGYGVFNFKYSNALTNLFGFAGSRHSQYYDLSANLDTGFWGLTANAHVGYQYVRNVADASYLDWKLGLSKELAKGLTVSLAYVDTNAKRSVYTNAKGRFMGREAALLTLTQAF
ncbi:hypothetical protein FXN63_17870 [Pigmentiphaga aceris]|uniref:Uncharacterized protein n=1 Tax=Pigmentiphaga aceris TaxID=1940612 RepID=A0A5C0B4N8_9BURK|nr:TorF family putative porin [Pigmentiphaga aceris]QEI07497.1 hypothetical protein FXN63_17870 [Pigmentiphaga aceris]